MPTKQTLKTALKKYYSYPKNIIGNILFISGIILQVVIMLWPSKIHNPCAPEFQGMGFKFTDIPFSYILIAIGLFLSDSKITGYFKK